MTPKYAKKVGILETLKTTLGCLIGCNGFVQPMDGSA